MAQHLDLEIDQGADRTFELQLEDCFGGAVDLTGFTGRMQVRAGPMGRKADELTTENGRIEIESNLVRLIFTHAVTEKLPSTPPEAPGLAYDLEIVSTGGEVSRVCEGAFIVHPNITR